MKPFLTLIVLFLMVGGCGFKETSTSCNYCKTLDLKVFLIEIPNHWHYKEQQGIDSFVGRIEGEDIVVEFDYSSMGYANSLNDNPEMHNYDIDTISHFVVKTVIPKKIGNGITGVYYQDLKSDLNFNLYSIDLERENQDVLLTSIKTIRIKD